MSQISKEEAAMKKKFLKQRQSLPKSPNRFERMNETHPKLLDYCINKLGCGRVLDFIGVKY